MKSLILAFGLLASGCAVIPPTSYPVATLSIDGQAMCTGVPIAAQVVLTATHCLIPGVKVDGADYVVLAHDGNDHSLVKTEAVYGHVAELDVQAAKGIVLPTGTSVTAYGHPMGLDIQLRRGYVMGTHDAQVTGAPVGVEKVVLLDMPILGGDSGGPVFDSQGELVGTISMASPLGGAIFPYGFSEEEWSLR
jgi:hypothetical protein